jgi:hypothetical protein
MDEGSFYPIGGNMLPTPHDGFLETNLAMDSVEQNAFGTLRDPNADINVYVFGGLGIRHWYDGGPPAYLYQFSGATGIAKIETRESWVDGDYSGVENLGYEATGDMKTKYVMHTIAHEMGHIIVGTGHPDVKTGPGPAPLLGTNHLERLMVSGGGKDRATKINCRLVKGEWDAAEEWLKNRPKGDR